MKRILKRPTKTPNPELLTTNGGASVNADRRSASRLPSTPDTRPCAPSTNADRRSASRPLLQLTAGAPPLSTISKTPPPQPTAPRPSTLDTRPGGARVPASRVLHIAPVAGLPSTNADRRSTPKLLNSQLINSKTPLELALKSRLKSQSDLSDLNKLLTEKSARQTALEKTGNLNDPAVITEIATLQVFTNLLPRRIASKEADDANAEQTLIKATNDFIHQHLGPRIRKLAFETREKGQAELKPHLRDPRSLIIAVTESDRVRTIEALSCTITAQPPQGAIAHAEAALKSWTAADKFEKTLIQ